MRVKRQTKSNIFILVVEDSLTQAEEIQYFLEENDYDVSVTHNGEEGLQWLQSTQRLPDVIVSDVVMPKMDGYELSKAIRADESLKNIPIILLTSLSEPQDIIKSIEAGANKFLVKPFDHKRLPEVIDELYINTQRRNVEKMEMGIRLIFGGKDFLITADKVQILDLLLSSYEDAYYKNIQLQENRSELERLNAQLESKVQERTHELKVQKEQFRTLSEHTPDLISRIDKNMNFAYINQAVENLFEISREKLIGKPISKLGEITKNGEYGTNIGKVFSTHKEIHEELEITTPQGKKWIDSKFLPEFDEKGVIEYVLSVSRDITEGKEKDRIMILQSRQAAMGDMIAMIAHQWRQPLSIIGMSANNLRASIELEEEITPQEIIEYSSGVNEQVQLLSQTIDDFRDYFKPNQQKQNITVGEVLKKVMKLIQKSLENNNIDVEIINKSETQLLTYPNQLIQVFINIINNAKDILKSKENPKAKIKIIIEETKDSVKTKICDNGGGITKEAMEHLGEPYFTTKSKSGTGLGIYMSKQIITEHLDGNITWKNLDDGACFEITLPKKS